MTPMVFQGDGSVLQASLVASGLTESAFRESVGWEVQLEQYRHDAGTHLISEEDAGKLRSEVVRRAVDRRFWASFVSDARRRAADLAEAARSLPGQDLNRGFDLFAGAVQRLVPFVAGRATVQAELEGDLGRRIGEKLDGEGDRAPELLHEFLASRRESQAGREVRSFYRIASSMSRNEDVVGLVVDRSSPRALKTLAGEYPALHNPLLRHVDEYGWLRTRHHPLPPVNAKDLVQRLQKVFLRWDPETLGEASKPLPRSDAGAMLGFEPTQEIAEGLAVMEDLVNLRDLREDALLHAHHLARDFFHKVALTLKCSHQDVMLLTAEELAEALSGSGPLPRDEMAARAEALPPPPTLQGQSVSLGRAVGRVRVLASQPSRQPALRFGDVVVTGLSSPDHAGNPSVFPTRTDAAVAIEEAAAIVIDEGGLLSHAAMISREHGIPCVAGTGKATSELSDGQVVEVDATRAQGSVISFEYI